MAQTPETSTGQEALLVVGAHRSDPMVVRNFDEVAVGLVEHDLRELNALALFSAANVREGLINSRQAAVRLFGRNAPAVLSGALRNRRELLDQAKNEIYHSVGYYVVEAAIDQFPDFDLTGLERDTYRHWDAFQRRFRGSANVMARHSYARQLRDHITDIQTGYHRYNDQRPHMPDKVRKEHQLPELSSRDRLIAISEDPRTQYLPSNNREKTIVMGWLDYLDNPEYPLGINDHFYEIFSRNWWLGRKRGDPPEARRDDNLAIARRSGISITYELFDLLQNSREGLEALTDLGTKLEEFVNPNVTLGEELADGHPAFAFLVRYRDQARYRDTGESPEAIKDPFRGHEDRWERGVVPGKHKNVEDMYTGKDKSKKMKEYVHAEAASLSIKHARELWQAATQNEQVREAFLSDRVEDIASGPRHRHLPIAHLAIAFRDRPPLAV